jgi:hypothetical protein
MTDEKIITKKTPISIGLLIIFISVALVIGGTVMSVKIQGEEIKKKVSTEKFDAVIERIEDKLDLALNLK